MALGDPIDKRLARISQHIASAKSTDAAMVGITKEVVQYHYDRIGRWLLKTFEMKIQYGPFAGMLYTVASGGTIYPPKLIGSYQSELHPVLQRIVANKYRTILHVGAGDGYTAVGLARLLPDATVYAFDSDPDAAKQCQKLASDNGVAKRVVCETNCDSTTFERHLRSGSLLICDLEGGELDLLNPANAPSLARADILAECNDYLPTPISKTLTARFKPTHKVAAISNSGINPNSIPFLRDLLPIQKLFAIWEGRPGPTPWLWMTVRERQR